MKFALMGLATLFSINAFASGSYQCKGNPTFGTSEALAFSLQSIGMATNAGEGVQVPYIFTLTLADQSVIRGQGTAAFEDVQLDFKGYTFENAKLNATIYMDELEQTTVYYKGMKLHFDCN